MRAEFQTRADRLAVLIDTDNASASLAEPLLKEIAKYGTANVKRLYGNWTKPQLGSWKDKLNEFGIQPIQQFEYTKGKNSTDSALIIDAMDLLYTQNFDGFCIVSSDSDFTRLASRIREAGLVVYGFGERKTPKPFVVACDKFIYTEILEEPKDRADHPVTDRPTGEKNDQKLVNLLRDAYEAIAEEDGWPNLGPVGAKLTKLSPSFNSRNFGYKKLGELTRAIDLFEIDKLEEITADVKAVHRVVRQK